MTPDFKTHLFSYRFGGLDYSIGIPARSIHEAHERIKAIALMARYDGILDSEIKFLPDRAGGIYKWLRSLT